MRFLLLFIPFTCLSALAWQDESSAGSALVAAMLGKTQMIENLENLTDEIGGRPTGSLANERAVNWALQRFRERGVSARKEAFTMPALWLEKDVTARIEGDITFPVEMVAMPYSIGTDRRGIRASIVDVGEGQDADFARLGEKVKGALVLVHTRELRDLGDLFREYGEAPLIDERANAMGAAGVVYMSSRPQNLLYRHKASMGSYNKLPMLIMEREAAKRTSRLLTKGKNLQLRVMIDLASGPAYTAYNVIGEIPGTARPEEFVVIGAHLDSWDLGTGALDNGCNVAMLLEIAAQMQALNLKPKRTIRFCLWNGEEQGLFGSWGYTQAHASELDRHVMAASLDIGSGKLRGFYVDGPKEFANAVDASLLPVAGLGPYTHFYGPVVGTDNYDFMMQGIATLVGNQDSANYAPNYHARSDTFDKVDQEQLRLNGAIVAAVTWSFAHQPVTWERRTRAQLEELIKSSEMEPQMRSWNTWDGWQDGTRGRQ